MCKKCQNIFIGLKKTCLGVLDRRERKKDNETGLKEEGGIEISTTVLFHIRDARSHLPSLQDYNTTLHFTKLRYRGIILFLKKLSKLSKTIKQDQCIYILPNCSSWAFFSSVNQTFAFISGLVFS